MKKYEVEYWILRDDCYDNEYITVEANSGDEAIAKARNHPSTHRGKDFTIYKEL